MTTNEIFDRADWIDDAIKMEKEDAAIAAFEREEEEANLDAQFDEFDYESEIVRMAEWYDDKEITVNRFDSFILSFAPGMRDAVHDRLEEFGIPFFRRGYVTTVEIAARKNGVPVNVAGFVSYNSDLGVTVIAGGRAGEPLERLDD